jgi:hypothetical protein
MTAVLRANRKAVIDEGKLDGWYRPVPVQDLITNGGRPC